MCLYLFAVHSLTTRNPFLDPRLILNRDFFLSLLLVSGYGFLTVPPIVLMPAFLEHIRGHEIEAVGMLQSPRGLGMLFAMFISGRIAGKFDPRISIACGLMCLMVTNWEMSRWNTDVGEWPIIWTGLLQGLGGGIMLVPIQMIAFPTLAPEQRTEATAVYNLVRNTIASVGVSVTLTLFVIASGTARSNFVQYITPYRAALHYQEAARFKTDTQHGLAVIDKEIDKQAAMMGYNASFLLLAVASAAGLPVLFMFSRKSRALRHSVSRREAPALVAE
jgi:MFS transporter, DHA2 family, multidrug resistance protein